MCKKLTEMAQEVLEGYLHETYRRRTAPIHRKTQDMGGHAKELGYIYRTWAAMKHTTH